MSRITGIGFVIVLVNSIAATNYAQAQLAVQKTGGGLTRNVAISTNKRLITPWSGSLRWLMLPQVGQEIELIDDQSAKIAEIRSDVQGKMSAVYKELQKLPRAERAERYAEKSKAIAEETEQRIKDVLLPEQLERLKQVSLQMRLRSYGGYGYVLASDGALAEELSITETQKKKLRAVQQKYQQKLQEQMRELRERMQREAKKQALTVLTPKQRERFEALLGDDFEYPSPQTSAKPGEKR